MLGLSWTRFLSCSPCHTCKHVHACSCANTHTCTQVYTNSLSLMGTLSFHLCILRHRWKTWWLFKECWHMYNKVTKTQMRGKKDQCSWLRGFHLQMCLKHLFVQLVMGLNTDTPILKAKDTWVLANIPTTQHSGWQTASRSLYPWDLPTEHFNSFQRQRNTYSVTTEISHKMFCFHGDIWLLHSMCTGCWHFETLCCPVCVVKFQNLGTCPPNPDCY